ncbi:MAG TPA: zf-HC2 domain-containing protein [Bryobacteraceae bacterium]|nr:zf-HC2 domain-containing protein [Bryobacteraceae bacterium]
MSNLEMRHPDDGQLLRYLDGELGARKARQVKQHLEACWQCRTELQELQDAVTNCVRYRRNVLETGLPAPPNPWTDLTRGFTEIDASLTRKPLQARLAALLPSRPVTRRLATAVTALVVIGAIVHQLRETPEVEAATLLKKAIVAAEVRPPAIRRIRIRTRTREFTRVIGEQVAAAETQQPVEALFRAANYNWDDPLSAKSYQDWRESLVAKSDEVQTIQDPQSPSEECYQIRTQTSSGELLAATLTLRMTDFRPVEGRFEFRNQDWVELTELSGPWNPPAPAVARSQVSLPHPAVAPLNEHAAAPRLAAFGDELQVIAALHNVGADLGDPLEITRSGSQVVVSGTGIPAHRQKQIHDALGSLPNVVVRFSEPAPVPAEPEAPASGTDTVSPEALQSQARIEALLGGRPQFERFSSQVLDWNDAGMSRAFALRRLAQAFPPEAERQLSAADRGLLRNLGAEHVAAFQKSAANLERALTPVLVSLGATAVPQEPAAQATAWQPASEELLDSARRVETLLAVFLGMAPPEQTRSDVAAQLREGLAQLDANLRNCTRLLSRNGEEPEP